MANLILERKVNSGSYSVIATLPYPTVSYVDTDSLVNGSTYYYRARILDDTVYSEYSTEMSVVYSNITGETNLTGEGILVVLATTYKIITASTALNGQLDSNVIASRYFPHLGAINITGAMTNNVVPLVLKVASTNVNGINTLNVVPIVLKYANTLFNGVDNPNVISTLVKVSSANLSGANNLNVISQVITVKYGSTVMEQGSQQTFSAKKTAKTSTLNTSGFKQTEFARKYSNTIVLISMATNTKVNAKINTQSNINIDLGTNQSVISKKNIRDSTVFTVGSVLKTSYSKGINRPTSNTLGFKQLIEATKKTKTPLINSLTLFDKVGVNRNSIVSNVYNSIGNIIVLNDHKGTVSPLDNSIGPKQIVSVILNRHASVVNELGSRQNLIDMKKRKTTPIPNSLGYVQNTVSLTHRRNRVIVATHNGFINSLAHKKSSYNHLNLSNNQILFLRSQSTKNDYITIFEGLQQDLKSFRGVVQPQVLKNGVIQYIKWVKSVSIPIEVKDLVSVNLSYYLSKFMLSEVESNGERQLCRAVKSILSEDTVFTEGFNQDLIYILNEDNGLTCINKPTGIRILSTQKTVFIILSPLGNDIAIISPLKTNVKEVDCND